MKSQLENTCFLVMDAQKGLWPYLEQHHEVGFKLQTTLKIAQILSIPSLFSGQEGLGDPICDIKQFVNSNIVLRRSFSLLDDPSMRNHIQSRFVREWVLVGAEAHVAVLQTALGLRKLGETVTVLNDCVTSRSVFDYSTALGLMRDSGVKISSMETEVFQWLNSLDHPQYQEVSGWLRSFQYPSYSKTHDGCCKVGASV